MAAEAQTEGPEPAPAPAPAPPPPLASRASPSPEKRVLPGDGAEEERRLPDSKRRRACVAALDSVPCAAASAEEVARPGSGCDADGASFSFPRARGGFVAPETTPKFGSFNPPGAAEEAATLDLKPAQPDADGDGSPEADHEVPAPAASACGAEEQGVEVDGQGIEIAW